MHYWAAIVLSELAHFLLIFHSADHQVDGVQVSQRSLLPARNPGFLWATDGVVAVTLLQLGGSVVLGVILSFLFVLGASYLCLVLLENSLWLSA